MKTIMSWTCSSAGRVWWNRSAAPSSALVLSSRLHSSPSSSSCQLRRRPLWWWKSMSTSWSWSSFGTVNPSARPSPNFSAATTGICNVKKNQSSQLRYRRCRSETLCLHIPSYLVFFHILNTHLRFLTVKKCLSLSLLLHWMHWNFLFFLKVTVSDIQGLNLAAVICFCLLHFYTV